MRSFVSRPGRLLLLVLLGSVGVALLAADLRVLARRVQTAPAVVLVRTGAAMTRERPRTLVP